MNKIYLIFFFTSNNASEWIWYVIAYQTQIVKLSYSIPKKKRKGNNWPRKQYT